MQIKIYFTPDNSIVIQSDNPYILIMEIKIYFTPDNSIVIQSDNPFILVGLGILYPECLDQTKAIPFFVIVASICWTHDDENLRKKLLHD